MIAFRVALYLVMLSAVGSIGAFRLVTSKNVVHAALYLVLTLSMVGAAYLVLAAGFLAWVQVLIIPLSLVFAAIAIGA